MRCSPPTCNINLPTWSASTCVLTRSNVSYGHRCRLLRAHTAGGGPTTPSRPAACSAGLTRVGAWRVSTWPNRSTTFERIPERQRRLIQFFVQLHDDLKERMELPDRLKPPSGEPWHVLAPVAGPHGEGMYYIAAFAPDNHFRLELYIDTGNRERNNHIFDWLAARRQAVEQELGAQLSWERMDDRRAARIAWVHSGSISDSDAALAQLRSLGSRRHCPLCCRARAVGGSSGRASSSCCRGTGHVGHAAQAATRSKQLHARWSQATCKCGLESRILLYAGDVLGCNKRLLAFPRRKR